MTLFTSYSSKEIQELLERAMALNNTNDGDNPELNEDQVIQDILESGIQLFGSEEMSERSFTIKESFESIPIQENSKANRSQKGNQKLLTEIKKHNPHKRSMSRSLEKCNKYLQRLLEEQGSVERVKQQTSMRVGEATAKLHADHKQRQDKRMKMFLSNAVNKHKVEEEERLETTGVCRIPFKKAREIRGEEVKLGHRLYDNAEVQRKKKEEALLARMEQQQKQEKELTFKPLIHSKSFQVGSFYERLASSTSKSIIKKAQVMQKQLKKTTFKPKLISKQSAKSKITQLWRNEEKEVGQINNLREMRESRSREMRESRSSHSMLDQHNLSNVYVGDINKSQLLKVDRSSCVEVRDLEDINFLLE